jgi:hypothetical protein
MTGVREAVTSLEGRVVALEARWTGASNASNRRSTSVSQSSTTAFWNRRHLDRISNQLFGLIVAVAVAAVGGILGIVTALFR